MWTTIIGAALGAVLGALATITAARINAGASAEVARLPPYEALADRVSKLEEQVGELRATVERLQDRDNRWVIAWTDLRDRWAVHRMRDTPPPFPVDIDTQED